MSFTTLQLSNMEFFNGTLLVYICFAMFVSLCDTAVIRKKEAKLAYPWNSIPCKIKIVGRPHQEKLKASTDVEVTFDCRKVTTKQRSYGNAYVINSESPTEMCYYILVPLALLSFAFIVFKVIQKMKNKLRLFRFPSMVEKDINRGLQEALSDMENGKLDRNQSATPENKNLVDDATVATKTPSPVAKTSPKGLPTVLSEGDSLLKAAFLSGPNDQGHLWYADHTQVFQQVTVDSRDNNEQIFESDGACKYETLPKPTQVNNPIYKLLEDIILPDDTFGYDEEVDAINHIYSMDDFLGFKHLGVMPYY